MLLLSLIVASVREYVQGGMGRRGFFPRRRLRRLQMPRQFQSHTLRSVFARREGGCHCCARVVQPAEGMYVAAKS